MTDAASGRLEALRILVADDSDDIASTLSMFFEMEGAEVSIASNGKEAWALLENGDFDILVSDLGMPVMDGYTLLVRLRHGKRNAGIPAIALTGNGYSEKARLVGFTAQVCKPVSMIELTDRVVELAMQARSEAAARNVEHPEAGE